ncbi:MAG: glycosyltransferase family 4 protein [Anaerolineales bacterium]|nr:glycosyltransferase family 4 protein [Anaerolineales bacterium]
MKILHVVQGYHPVVGGSEWLVKNISEQLVTAYQDEVTVFTAAATKPAYFWRNEGAPMPAGTECINGVTVRRFKLFRGLRFLRMLWAHSFHRLRLPYHDWARTIQLGPLIFDMPQAIAQSGADVVFATSFPFMHMYYAVVGARRANIPVVLLGAIHTADKWGYDRKMMIRAIQQADAYIAHTHFEQDYLVERGIPADKIRVIGGGVDIKQFEQASGTAVRQQYGWGNDPVIGVLARQSVLKRLDTVLYAMSQVWEAQPNARLLLAGARTAYSDQLEQIIRGMTPEQQARITVVHNFPEEMKPDLLAAIDMFVHPSGNESFGIVLVEAWACGKPVIGARMAAIPSVIDEGENGLLFTYEDPDSLVQAIINLLENPQKRAQMGEAGRQKVLANYTWPIVANRVRKLYVDVINGRSTQPLESSL